VLDEHLAEDSEERTRLEAEFERGLAALPEKLPGLPGAGVSTDRRKDGSGLGIYLICMTPCSDGKCVVAVFPTGIAVAYDLDGQLLWSADVRPPAAPPSPPPASAGAAGPLAANDWPQVGGPRGCFAVNKGASLMIFQADPKARTQLAAIPVHDHLHNVELAYADGRVVLVSPSDGEVVVTVHGLLAGRAPRAPDN
jgi:hypothetical protein